MIKKMIRKIAIIHTTDPTTAPAIQAWLVEVEKGALLKPVLKFEGVLDGVLEGAYNILEKII
jgi:hypothetical protein